LRLFKRIFLIIILLGIIFLGFWLVRSPYFKVKEINFSGNEHYTQGELRKQVESLWDENIVFLDVKGKVMEPLEELPWVKEVNVSKDVFKMTINIAVTERKPVAIIQRDGQFLLVDVDGRILEDDIGQPQSDLLLLKYNDISEGMAGEYISNNDVMEFLIVVKDMSKDIRKQYVYAAFTEKGLVFYDDSGFYVIYQDSSDSAEKDVSIKTVLNGIKGGEANVEYIDVSVPDFPVVKYKNGNEELVNESK
jgi:cell division septal protein FtsQ